MPNPLLEAMANNNNNPMLNTIKQFNEFKRMFSGDPKQQVEQLLSTGRVSREQYEKAVAMANQLQQIVR